MHVYKFRILTDIVEDFVRDVELLSNQTFEDLHYALQRCIGLNGKELASFHICDRDWHKIQEITLIDMMEGEPASSENGHPRVPVMRNSVLSNFVSKEGQRMLYEYDFLNMHTFFIEIIEVKKPSAKAKYPVCTRKRGSLDLEDNEIGNQAHEEELSRKLLSEFDDILKKTYDYGDEDYSDSYGFDD